MVKEYGIKHRAKEERDEEYRKEMHKVYESWRHREMIRLRRERGNSTVTRENTPVREDALVTYLKDRHDIIPDEKYLKAVEANIMTQAEADAGIAANKLFRSNLSGFLPKYNRELFENDGSKKMTVGDFHFWGWKRHLNKTPPPI